MKFYCDACNTKYAISDEKVRGKVLKVRCKNCGNIITVREAQAPVVSSPAPSAPTAVASTGTSPQSSGVPTTNWYYALNGQTFGPFTLNALREKYTKAQISDATYVWHEKIVDWKPVTTVDAFKAAVAEGHKIRPRRQTVGFSGELQAVQAADVQKQQGPQTGAAPQRSVEPTQPARASQPAPKQAQQPRQQPKAKPERPTRGTGAEPSRPSLPKKQAGQAPTPESRPVRDLRQEKLERLRAKLSGGSEPAESQSEPEVDANRVASQPSASEWDDVAKTEALPQPVEGEATFTFADGVTPASSASSQELPAAKDAVDFGLPPRAAEPKPSPSSTSDILEAAVGPIDEPQRRESPVDSGVIPVFSEAPSLEGSAQNPATGSHAAAQGSGQTSGSLLIQLSEIQKEGRGKRWLIPAVGLLLVVGLVAGAVAISMSSKDDTPTTVEPTATKQSDHKDELVVPTYSKDEVGKIATLELEEEMLFNEEGAAAEEAPAEKEQPKAKQAEPEKEKVKLKGIGSKQGSAKQTGSKEVASAKGSGAKAAEEPTEEPDDIYKALLSERAGKQSSINAPPDKILDSQGNATGMSKEQARRGFKRVKRSVRDCRERHNRHNARLDAGKIKLSVTVQPSGKVSKFTVRPRSVQNTEFERCMQSHKGRWRFPPFGGKEVVINTSIIMQ